MLNNEVMDVNLIVAVGKDGAIGRGGELIWKIPADLKRFKALTTGHPVVMGRKTWESLPKKPLPSRRNIILSRQKDFSPEGAEVVNSVEEALQLTCDSSPFIIGGTEIYNAFLPHVNHLYLTLVDDTCGDADAHLHLDLDNGWELIEEMPAEKTPDGISYQYKTYRKK